MSKERVSLFLKSACSRHVRTLLCVFLFLIVAQKRQMRTFPTVMWTKSNQNLHFSVYSRPQVMLRLHQKCKSIFTNTLWCHVSVPYMTFLFSVNREQLTSIRLSWVCVCVFTDQRTLGQKMTNGSELFKVILLKDTHKRHAFTHRSTDVVKCAPVCGFFCVGTMEVFMLVVQQTLAISHTSK